MRLKADAYEQYGDAAVASLVLEAMPKVAAAVAAPLAKTKQIVIVGGVNRTTEEVARLSGTLPPAVQALTGIDIAKMIEKAVEGGSRTTTAF